MIVLLNRTGLGDTSEYSTTGMLSLSQQHCDSAWSLLNPFAWFGGCLEADKNYVKSKLADQYEVLQYGHIPRPGELPAAPVPGVPGGPSSAEQWAQWRADVTYALANQQASGEWNPAGNLPVDMLDLASFWKRYGTITTIGGAALVAYLVLRGRR